MSKLIRLTAVGATLAQDVWTTVTLAQCNEGSLAVHSAADTKLLLPLTVWQEEREALIANDAPSTLGVWLDSHEDAAALKDDLNLLSLVAVNFPTFKDGRGYSIAYLLRERYGYKGELRAIGEVLRDQLFYLKRVGFDAFQLREDTNVEEAIAAFNDFSTTYQASVDQPIPLYQRRLAAARAAQ